MIKLTFSKIVGEFGHHRSFIDEYAILAEPLISGLGLTDGEKQIFRKTDRLPDPKTLSKKKWLIASSKQLLLVLPHSRL